MRSNFHPSFLLTQTLLIRSLRWVPVFVLALIVVSWCEGQPTPLPVPTNILKGHTETIYSLAYSPDGKQIITGSFDKTIKVWDANSGKEIRTLTGPQGHKQMVLGIAVSQDGTLIASGSSDNLANVWDYPMSAPQRKWNLGEVVYSATSTPDGTKAAAGLKDGSIRLWKTADPKEPFKEPSILKGHTGPVNSLVFLNNGLLLASGGVDGTIRTWNTVDNKAGIVIGAQVGPVTSLLSSQGTSLYSSGEDGTIKSWNLLTKAFSSGDKKHTSPVIAFAVSSDGAAVVTASKDSIVRVHQGEGFKTTKDIETKDAGLNKLSISPDKKWIVTGNDKGFASLWSVSDGKMVSTKLIHPEGLVSLEFSTVRADQFLSAGKTGLVKIWQVPQTVLPASVPLQEVPLVSSVSADGKKWVWVGASKQIRLTSNSANTQTTPIGTVLKNLPMAILSGEAEKNAYLGFADGSILLQNAEKKDTLIQAHLGKLNAFANPAGMLLTSGEDGFVRSWKNTPAATKEGSPEAGPKDIFIEGFSKNFWMTLPDGSIKTGNSLGSSDKGRILPKPAMPYNVAAFSYDAQLMALAENDSLQLIKTDTKKQTRETLKLPSVVKSLVIRNDGKLVVAGLADGKIAVVEAEGKAEPKIASIHMGEVVRLEFTPNGLLSFSTDKSVKLSKVTDWTVAASANLEAGLTSVRVAMSGKKIVLGLADKSVRILDSADLKTLVKIPVNSNPISAAFDNEEKKILVALEGFGLAIYLPDGIPLEYLPMVDPVLAVTWSSDNTKALALLKDKGFFAGVSNANWAVRVPSPVNVILPLPGKDISILGCEDGKLVLVKNADGKIVSDKNSLGAPVKHLKVSRDGTTCAVVGKDGKVVVLLLQDLITDNFKPLATWNIGPVNAFELSSDGKQAGMVLEKETNESSRVLDVSLGKEIYRIVGEPAKNLQFLPEPKTFAVMGKDSISFNDVGLFKLIDTGNVPVQAALYGPTENVVYTFSEDKTPRRWDVITAKETLKLNPLAEPLNGVVLSRDGTLFAVTSGKNVRILKAADGKDLWVLGHPKEVSQVAFSPDKSKLVTTCLDGIARTWDLALGRQLEFFDNPGFSGGVSFHPNGNSIYAIGNDGALHVLNLAITKVLVTGLPVRNFVLAPGQQSVWAACDDKVLRSWNLGTNQPEKMIEAGANVLKTLAFSPNGQIIATGGLEPEVRFFQANDLKLISVVKVPGVVKTIVFIRDQLIAVGTEDGSIQLLQIPFSPGQPLDPGFGKVAQVFEIGSIPNAISFSKEGKVLFTADSANHFNEWKIAGDAPQKSFGHPNFVDAVAFDSKGTTLATGCHDGKVRLFDVIKGTLVKEIEAHTKAEVSPVYNVIWSQDGKKVISSSMQGSVKAWDIPSGNLVYEIKPYKEKEADNGHKEGVFTLAISPDQSILATAGGDRVIKLWNLQDGKFIRNLVNKSLPNFDKEPNSHPGWVYSIRFTPDGKQLLAVGGAPKGKGFLSQWKVGDGSLIASHEVLVGVLYSLGISPDALSVATSAGTGKQGLEFNQGLIIKLPGLK